MDDTELELLKDIQERLARLEEMIQNGFYFELGDLDGLEFEGEAELEETEP